MKTIAAFFDEPETDDYPFSVELYRIVYRQLAEIIAAKGGALYVVRNQKTFLHDNTFSKAWKVEQSAFVPVSGPAHFDLIWNKASFVGDPQTNVINDPELDRIATDKWESYQHFPTLHARTLLVHTTEEFLDAVHQLTADILVVKPLEGKGGEGVIIAERDKVIKATPEFPCIVQEYVDTSGGIPGIVDGMHDLRVILLGGKIGLSYIRTPPSGEKTANVSRGGREIEVLQEQIPAGAMKLVKEVDQVMERFPRRIYTVDMGLGTDGRWYLFEINAKPGFSPKETGKSYGVFYEHLADFLLHHC